MYQTINEKKCGIQHRCCLSILSLLLNFIWRPVTLLNITGCWLLYMYFSFTVIQHRTVFILLIKIQINDKKEIFTEVFLMYQAEQK